MIKLIATVFFIIEIVAGGITLFYGVNDKDLLELVAHGMTASAATFMAIREINGWWEL